MTTERPETTVDSFAPSFTVTPTPSLDLSTPDTVWFITRNKHHPIGYYTVHQTDEENPEFNAINQFRFAIAHRYIPKGDVIMADPLRRADMALDLDEVKFDNVPSENTVLTLLSEVKPETMLNIWVHSRYLNEDGLRVRVRLRWRDKLTDGTRLLNCTEVFIPFTATDDEALDIIEAAVELTAIPFINNAVVNMPGLVVKPSSNGFASETGGFKNNIYHRTVRMLLAKTNLSSLLKFK